MVQLIERVPNTTLQKIDVAPPPIRGTDPRHENFSKFFENIYEKLFKDGGVFPKLAVEGQDGKATFTPDYMFQQLLKLDSGLYATYSSSIDQIIYGFAANVYRSGGVNLAVGCQCSALAGPGVNGTTMFGSNFNAIQAIKCDNSLIAIEADIANNSSVGIRAKIGIDLVFANYNAPEGLGSNHYNTFSTGIRLTSTGRSAAGEFNGWNVGIDFLDGSMDTDLPPAWNNTTTYAAGQCVTNGGLVWKAMVPNINVAPPGAAWVQRSLGNVNLAVGIDFSSMTAATATRMWSAIRLKAGMLLSYDEIGVHNTFYDAANTRWVLSTWTGAVHTRNFQVDTTNGELWLSNGVVPLGAGAVATLGKIGNANGPAAAAQAAWYRYIESNTGTPRFFPVWQ